MLVYLSNNAYMNANKSFKLMVIALNYIELFQP